MTIATQGKNIVLRPHHKAQEYVVANSRRFNVVVCGRRWGKTDLGQDLAVSGVLEGKLVGWFAPNYKYLRATFKAIKEILAPILDVDKKALESNKTENIISIPGYGSIEFWTLEDEDAGRSRKYDIAIIDEAGLVLELAERWKEAIRATLIDREGVAWFFGTPKPPRSVQLKDYAFYQFYIRGTKKYREENAHKAGIDAWRSFKMPSKMNPTLPPEEIEAMRNEPGMTERIARQELDAEFLSESTDALWNTDLIERNRGKIPADVKIEVTVLFVDPGNFSEKEDADKTGIVIVSRGDNGHYYVENNLSGAYTPNQMGRIVVNASAHYNARVYYETNQGGQYIKSTIRNVSAIPVTGVPSTKAKEQRALAPLSAYEMGLVHHTQEFVELEDQMVNWSPYDKKAKSPNEIDALVGAMNVLMKGSQMGMKRSTRIKDAA